MNTRKPLSGIVTATSGGGDDEILDLFDRTTAADDFGPVPKGAYVALAVGGQRTTARTGTPGYNVEFRIIEGEFAGRRLWRTWFFTPAAMQYTKRDLAKLGITGREQLAAPFPANRMVVKLLVTLRKDDDGTEKNEVTDLKFLRTHEPEADPFAPEAGTAEGGEQ